MNARTMCVGIAALLVWSARAQADQPNKACDLQENKVIVRAANANLVAKLENPPRTRVSLSVDANGGFHRQIVWDPTVGDGLKHDVLLPAGEYTLLGHAEEDRVQTPQLVIMTTTQFTACKANDERTGCESRDPQGALLVSSQRMLMVSAMALTRSPMQSKDEPGQEKIKNSPMQSKGEPGQEKIKNSPMQSKDEPGQERFKNDEWTPRIRLECQTGGVELSELHLDTKQLYAASVARGFLDQTPPAVVTDTLAILAEIAISRAKTGAMEIVKERFVGPICRELDLELLGLGNDGERAFPRACALLENLRLHDLLSAGHNLVEAARDDIRLTLVPRLVGKLDIPAAARDVAVLALELGNQLLDGGNEVTEIDLLVTQLDRMFRRGALASFDTVNMDFIRKTFQAIETQLGTETYAQRKEQFLRTVLQRVLPHDPGALLSSYVKTTLREAELANVLRLKEVSVCRRTKDEPKRFVAADLGACIDGVIAHLRGLPEWGKTDVFFATIFKALSPDQLVGLAGTFGAELNLAGIGNFAEWLEGHAHDEKNLESLLSINDPPALLARTCAVRITIAIVKWCSGRDTCTASEIATAFDRPETLFRRPEANSIDQLCWKKAANPDLPWILVLPSIRTPYVELASRAVGFLTPPAKGEELKRVQAMLRWMFALASTLDEKRASAVLKLQEIMELFEKRDYVRAIGQTMTMAIESRGCSPQTCSTPEALNKAMTLLGAVASYLQVYDDTKTADPAEARTARKKAIESLIDSSTDRKARGGNWIFSLGSTVGFTAGARWTSGTNPKGYADDDFGTVYDPERTLALRVPLGLAYQGMPSGGHHCGLHFALTFADLGNFLRGNSHDNDDDEVQWKDFLQFGAQAGITIGNRRHSVVLAADLAWSPGLYRRDVVITTGSTTKTVVKEGALVFGVTLAYYVPFFDLN